MCGRSVTSARVPGSRAWRGAFRYFGGVPREVLIDNARTLVTYHDPQTREVRFNERLDAFAHYWGFRPCACAPYRARTKGKDKRMVGYVKGNAPSIVLPGRRPPCVRSMIAPRTRPVAA